jgi:predicted ATPase
MNSSGLAEGSQPGRSGSGTSRGSTLHASQSPLTGRDTELGLLKDRWEQAQEGMGQVVLVIGEAGLGKSRLVQTLAESVRSADGGLATGEREASKSPSLIEWRCSEQFQHSELYPVTDYLERFIDSGRNEGAADRFERLARHLEDYEMRRQQIVALFAKLLLLPADERYSESTLTPAREREETFSALREWLLAQSRRHPILFILEDLHWIDASSLEFLSLFISEGPHDRILTVLTFRPEFKTPWPALAHQTNLALNRLTRRQVADWMRRDAGAALPDGLLAQIYTRSAGVPLLVEEFSRMACESAMFESTRSPARIVSRPRLNELPATLEDLVIARLDQISCDLAVVQIAAIIGREFDYSLLAAVVRLDEETLQRELSKLLAAGILYATGQPPASVYTFKHVLIEEALYSAVSEARKRQFHLQVAEAIEIQFGHLLEMKPEMVAEHLALAGATEKAIGFCLKAGMRS